MTEPGVILEAKNLLVERAGARLLDIPVFSVNKGEVLALIGPNGAGKTTLLLTLSYLMKPRAGELFFSGLRVGSGYLLSDYRRKLAMVFQEALLFDTTVYKNVASGLKFRGMRREEIQTRVTEQLELFGIGHLRDRSARTLSGGEAQRTSLARAFATSPEVLLLDEPFAALDPPTRESLVQDVEQVLRRAHTTTIITTHDRSEALRLSTRIAVMNQGRILQVGTPGEVMYHPVDEFVAAFVGIETIITGEVVRVQAGTFTVSVNGKEIEAVGNAAGGEIVTLCIRPENVTLSCDVFGSGASALNVFHGTITKITAMGLYQKVLIDCGFSLVAYLTNRSMERLALTEGQEINAAFKATGIHVMKIPQTDPAGQSPAC
ncbi:MAG: Spermidine/putrescine import ATP-binding protein PotA [Syntrophorhabdus sp. PtaU1.Bin153]|nr:MAG: Spermidine/putrescine import ATP-binding protein PotA [Syntrophorhabdus sp. PtaU1.Bin153]